MGSVLGTIASRCDFRDGAGLELLSDVYCQWLDPSSPQAGISSKMIVDATGPIIELTAGGEGAEKDVHPSESIKDISYLGEGSSSLAVVSATPKLDDLAGLLH